MVEVVKIIRVPGAVKEVALESGSTVADALAAADYELSPTETVTMNGVTVDMDTVVTDGARIILAKEAKSA